jgi:ubiquinone biosynthesis protein
LDPARSPWRDAAAAAPQLVFTAVRRGVIPLAPSTVAILRREGAVALHWKVLGDALVRFFRHSGPVLTKFGQLLATRGDLLPDAVCRRLEALYTSQPPMPRAELERILRRAYPRKRPFRRFRYRPVAVGSIGQVHRARLKDGRRVIVKIVRPGVERAIRRDLNAARAFVDLWLRVCARDPEHARAVAAAALEELGRSLAGEADLENEARALEEFARRLAGNPRVRVPVCHREWSSPSVLVLEELEGEPLSALRERARTQPGAARQAASLALREILAQIFEEGRFHADPHGGNLLLLEDGRLGLIDLGLTGELGAEDRRQVTAAVKALLARDADAAMRALLRFGTLPPDFDSDAFRADVAGVLRARRGEVAARVTGRASRRGEGSRGEAPALDAVVNELFAVCHRHRVLLPSSTTLLIKTLVTIEGLARSLDPDINVMVTALPIVLRSLSPRWLRWGFWAGR